MLEAVVSEGVVGDRRCEREAEKEKGKNKDMRRNVLILFELSSLCCSICIFIDEKKEGRLQIDTSDFFSSLLLFASRNHWIDVLVIWRILVG